MSYVSKNPRFTTTSITDSTTGSISSPPSGADKIINRNGVLYLKNSAGGETPIGSSSGGKNYLAKQSDASAAVGTVSVVAAGGDISVSGTFPNVSSAWYADAGAAAIAISSDNTLRGTSNYLTALTSFSAAGAVYVQTPAFNIDGEDLGKALAVQFDVAGNTTADDWDVVAVRYTSAGVFGALIPIAGIASTTTGTASAQVPTGTTTLRGFFITNSTASDVYSIRWRRRAGAVAIRFDNLIVGPNSVMLGTAITDWQSYTPTFTGFGTATAVEMFYRRIGDTLQVRGNFTCGTNTATEARMSIPTGLTTAAFPSIRIAGTVIPQGSSTTYFGSYLLVEPSVSYFTFGMQFSTINALTKTNANNLTSSGKIAIEGEVPITGYSSNVTMADRAVEEYVSNSGTSTTVSDTTNFAYGPSGNLITSITAELSRRVRFNTPIQATDKIDVELSADRINWFSSNNWVRIGGGYAQPFSYQGGTNSYGVGRIYYISGSTDVDVTFGKYSTVSSATYSAAGDLWSANAGAGYWRVRKVSGGAAVGFPVGARNVVGDTTGTAVPAGYIGEVLSQSRLKSAAVALTTATPANVTATSLTLTPGVWLLSGTVGFRTAATTSVTALFGAISTTSATIPASDTTAVPSSTGQVQLAQERAANVFGSADNNIILPPNVVVVTTSTPYFLVAQASFTVSTMTTYGFISAVRVA